MFSKVTQPAPKIFTAMLVAGLSSACGSDHMDDDDVSAFQEQIQAANTEVTRHHDATLAAPTLPAVMTEAGHHDTEMHRIMERMNGMMGGMMSHCSGSGMGRMHEMMGTMDSEMSSHRADTGNATTLDEARTECTAHTDSMYYMLENMHAGLRDMGCMANR